MSHRRATIWPVSGSNADSARQLPGLSELGPDARRRLGRLRALVAPVAADAGAVVDDPDALEVARAVCDAFVQGGAAGGLTKAQIIARIGDRVDRELLERRLTVFEKLGFLRTYLDKKHQQRYTIEPTSLVGQEVFERISRHGGVDELLALLVRTRSLLESQPDLQQLTSHLREIRAILSAYANELDRLVATAPLRELIAQRADHDRANALDELEPLAVHVVERFPKLQTLASDVVEEAQRYLGAVQAMMARILDEGGRARDFSILSADDYLTAAIDTPPEDLAAVFERVVFDAPAAWIGASDILAATGRRGTSDRERRPPEPAPSSDTDPVRPLLEAAEAMRRRRALAAERLLQGADIRDLTSMVQSLPWPSAARLLADLFGVDLDDREELRVHVGEATFVDPDAATTYVSPVELRRSDAAKPSEAVRSKASVDG